MKPETKQRIIGIVVLLAFAALLVPFLFTSGIRKKQFTSDEIPINAEKRQLITQQIQDMGSATATSTLHPQLPPTAGVQQPVTQQQSTTVQQPATAQQPTGGQQPMILSPSQFEHEGIFPPDDNQAEPAVNKEASQSAQVAASQTEAMVNAQQDLGFNTTSTESLASAEAEASAKAIQATSKVAKKSVVKKTGKNKTPKKVTKNSDKIFWSVQVGSFSNPVRIQKLIAELHQKGFRVYQQKVTTTKAILTRVLVGHEASKVKAKELAQKLLTTMKIKGQVVRNTK